MKVFIGTHLIASPAISIGDFVGARAIKLQAACAQRSCGSCEREE
jgi:hypothetical protein